MPLLKIEKSVLIFERKAMIVSILGLIFYSKYTFKRPFFLVFLRKSLSKCPSSTNQKPPSPPCPEKFWVAPQHSGIIIIFLQSASSQMFDSILNTSLYLDNYSDLLLCTASDTFRILAYLALCFSGICRHIQSYSALLRHLKIAY